ncbi:MAG: hypothetical protein OXF41_10940 [bacterium]|nr:hypothetical protein [bacterium]
MMISTAGRAALVAALTVALTVPAAAKQPPADEGLTVRSDFVGVGEAPEQGDSAVTVLGDAQGNYVILWASDKEGLDETPLFMGSLNVTQSAEAQTLILSYTNSGGWWACTTNPKRPTIVDDDYASGTVSQTCTGTAFKEHKLNARLEEEEGIGWLWTAKDEGEAGWSSARLISVELYDDCVSDDRSRWQTWGLGKIRYYNGTIQGYGEKILKVKTSARVWGDCDS